MEKKTLKQAIESQNDQKTASVIDKMSRISLQERFNQCVSEYINLFCKKQDMLFGYWIGDHIGQVCEINYFTFAFSDIQYDIDHNCEKGLIIEWYYDNLGTGLHINYHSFINWIKN
jgi:hypothetical protein